MGWNGAYKIISAAIFSFGGAGAIILAVVRLCSEKIADNLSKKYELKLNKELEKYKSNIENKTYMSKTKFDAEFLMYKDLSQTFSALTKECYQLFPVYSRDGRDDYKKYKNIYDKCIDVTVLAQDKLNSYAPFIDEDIYKKFNNIESMCKKQINTFVDFRLHQDADRYVKIANKEYHEAYFYTDQIMSEYNNLIDDLRQYLKTIDVI